MKPRSAKNKGKRLQNKVRDLILEKFNKLETDDVRSITMGDSGEDILLSPAARKLFPFSVECKNQEKLNVWDAYEQAKENCNGYEPIVVMKKNRKQPLVVIDAESFIAMCSRIGYNK